MPFRSLLSCLLGSVLPSIGQHGSRWYRAIHRERLPPEHEVWSAWKDRDAERIDALLGDPIQFIDIFGNHLSTRPEAVAVWSGRGCDVKGLELSEAKAKMLTPELGILTVRAATDGWCFGQDVRLTLATSIYVRHGHK